MCCGQHIVVCVDVDERSRTDQLKTIRIRMPFASQAENWYKVVLQVCADLVQQGLWYLS
jgi:hypothetical protein